MVGLLWCLFVCALACFEKNYYHSVKNDKPSIETASQEHQV